MHKLDLVYVPGDRVKIIPVEYEGIVYNIFIGHGLFVEYKIKYWSDGKIYFEYFFADELQLIEKRGDR